MKLSVIVTIRRLQTKLNQFFSHQDDPFKGVEHLIAMEESAKRWYVITHGYPEIDQSKGSDHKPDNRLLISTLIEISNYISMIRITILCFTDNEFLNTYCGDVFVGTPTRFYMNCTCTLGAWLLVIFRSMIYWSDVFDKTSWLTIFSQIKVNGFNSSFLRITPSGANEMRNKIYLARRFLTIACPLTVCFVPGILFYSFATNPNSLQYSKRLIFFQIFWSSILTLQAFPVVNATLWLITHIYLTTCYGSLQLDAISLTIDQLLSSSKWTLAQSNKIAIIDTKTRSLAKVDHINQRVRSIVDSHNYTSGYIFKLSDQIKYYIAIGYFYASFGADFLLYSATAMPKDHLYNNIIVTGLGIEILFFAMALILVLSKISVKVSILLITNGTINCHCKHLIVSYNL